MKSDPTIEGWVLCQLEPWIGRGMKRSDVEAELDRLWARQPWIALFEVADGAVRMREREGHPSYLHRSRIFLEMLSEAMASNPATRCTLAIDVRDEAPDNLTMPVFSFQKQVGQRNLLLPDMQFPMFGYYEAAPHDPLPFDQKMPKASFAGSTTGGGRLTLEKVTTAAFPRLRAANYFRGSEIVEFKLTELVQCASDEVAAALRAAGHGQGRIGWGDAFRNKFLISMDGNGAACSRPAIILRSHSALMLYESRHVLHYSHSLVPWVHYIPIRNDEDVVRIVEHEHANPGTFATVAAEGRAFAQRFLSREAARAYVARLVAAYAELLA